MQNKGGIKILAIAIALVSFYQLFFTYKTTSVEKTAREFAKGDPVKERAYLDSIGDKVVYNFLGIGKFTYKECKELELNLGLDLRGGMNVTMEVDVADVVKTLANNTQDPAFNQAIAEAKKMRKTNPKDFVSLFGEAFERIAPNQRLASPNIFGTVELKDKIKIGASNEQVLKVIRKEANTAIDNTFNILRTRIDRFGVAQPNIRKADISGRIIIELPGIKDAQRVRKLLQGTASLEFFETYDNADFFQYMNAANARLKEINDASKKEQKIEAKQDKKAKKDNSVDDIIKDVASQDSTKVNAEFAENNPLFSVLYPNMGQNGTLGRGSSVGYASIKDTARVNEILSNPMIKSLFPRNSRLAWESKDEKGLVSLHALKITTRTGKAPLDGGVVIDAHKEFNPQTGAPMVSMRMNGEGSKIWARMTKENINKSIAIVLDGYVVSSPNVENEIKGGSSQISGNFTVKQTEDLANILEAGKLPAPAHIIADEIIGPSLGRASIQSGMWSFVIAFGLVLVYMLFFYSKGAGLASNIALLTNLFFIFGILASFGAVLTLPGIAGIVLTMGMAVDANVLIYERIQEEINSGKGLILAIKDGYNNAYSAIIDSNVTSLLTGFILYYFGEGPIKGFATTFIIGIISSLFCAIFISRLIIDWSAKRNKNYTFISKMSNGWLRHTKVKFIQKRKVAYILSSIMIVIAIASLVTKGLDKGIDFVGGRTYNVSLDKPTKVEDITASLEKVYGATPLVTTFGTDNQFRIMTKYKVDEDNLEADNETEALLYKGLKQYLNDGTSLETFLNVNRTMSQKVGPAIAEDITRAALWSVIIALTAIFLYIMIRFKNWEYSAGAVISLAHDSLFILGSYSLFSGLLPFSLEIDQAFIAAILTVIGYSINDTVVVFDRIREYHALYPKRDRMSVDNSAMNSTLRRTLNTSFTTLIVLIAIFIFGGASIRGFVFALLLGIGIGTYSSIFVASPLAYDLTMRFRRNKK